MKCFKCFSSEEILTNHKKVCLEISGKQSVIFLKRVTMYNKVIITSIWAFETNLKKFQKPNRHNSSASYTVKCQQHISCSHSYKFGAFMIDLVNQCKHIRVKIQFNSSILNALKS